MDMKRIFKTLSGFLVIAAAVFVTAACTPPIGAIDADGSGGSAKPGDDALWAVPKRQIYDLNGTGNDTFDRSKDLQLFLSDKGAIAVIPIDEAEISIIENAGLISATPYPIYNGKYVFIQPGRKLVEVSYNGLTTAYSIEVHGLGYSGGEGSDFMGVIWF